MSDNELVKHVEAAYKAMKNPQTHWIHKVKEILVEIVIIVFAVSISIWFHNWSDSLSERKEEREFLEGMKRDLAQDLSDVSGDRATYASRLRELSYFSRVGGGVPMNADSLTAYISVFFSTSTPEPRVSRYEGLKASGKFGIIRNKELLNNLINLHEGNLRRVEMLDTYYYENVIGRISTYFEENARLDPAGTRFSNVQELVKSDRMRILTFFGMSFISGNVLLAHDSCIARCNELNRQIDQELKK